MVIYVISRLADGDRRGDCLARLAAAAPLPVAWVVAAEPEQAPGKTAVSACRHSHLAVLGAIAAAGEDALVLEDDAHPRNLALLAHFTMPLDAGLLFVNDRMTTRRRTETLDAALAQGKKVEGSDGYIVTAQGAAALRDYIGQRPHTEHYDISLYAAWRKGIVRAAVWHSPLTEHGIFPSVRRALDCGDA